MADNIKDLRRLVIKAFHMDEVEWGEHNDITPDGKMAINQETEFVISGGWSRHYAPSSFKLKATNR